MDNWKTTVRVFSSFPKVFVMQNRMQGKTKKLTRKEKKERQKLENCVTMRNTHLEKQII